MAGIGTARSLSAGEIESRGRPAESTPTCREPGLLIQLRHANRELLISLAIASHAAQRGALAIAASAISRCARQIHAVQRLEGVMLHPPISRCMSNDPDTMAAVNAVRREANALARAFVLLTEGWYGTAQAQPGATKLAEAAALLKRYVEQKESRLYWFYALVAPTDGESG